jgi:xylan 1,4-beta-xylosidase
MIAAALALSLATAHFDWFDYRGRNPDHVVAPAGHYRNPVLPGFYSDPSVVRVGTDYYLVTSTFSWFPGLPVFHSRDLVNWRQIGNAIDRPRQVDFAKLELSRGLFAASITHHDGHFMIVNTCVDCGGNFVLTARNPAGPWSDPIWIRGIDGAIDPSLYFAADGSRWIVYNGPPAGVPRYDGHRAIWLQRLDEAFQPVSKPTVLVDGGVHPADKPIWIEGPHLFDKDGWTYLIAAEGGTAEGHSEVVLRSRSVTGPYASFAGNPILTQRDMPRGRPYPVTSAGHAQFVQTPHGDWWATFLAVRPYAGDDYNIGRETFLMPVRWKDGWPIITQPGQPIPLAAPAPLKTDARGSGALVQHELFNGPQLPLDWMMMRNPRSRWWRTGKGLTLDARPAAIGDFANPSFVGRRLQHPDATVSTRVRFAARSEGDEAGLVAVQNDLFYFFAGVTRTNGRPTITLRRRAGPAAAETMASVPMIAARPVDLRMTMTGATARFAYRQGDTWRQLGGPQDATILSTRRAGGFVGALAGLYAHSGGPK